MRSAIIRALTGVLLLQGTPAPPSSLFTTPFGGSVVTLASTGSGELLAVQDFGALPASARRQTLFNLVFSSPETIRGVQIVIQPGARGEFAILSPFGNNVPIVLPAGVALPVMVEFRPKAAGANAAELQIYNGTTAARIITRIPLTGTAQ